MPACSKYPTAKYGAKASCSQERIPGTYNAKDNPVFFTDRAAKSSKKIPDHGKYKNISFT